MNDLEDSRARVQGDEVHFFGDQSNDPISNSENLESTDQDAPPGEVTVFHDLIAGGVAGSASVIVGHPFDTLKVRMQTSTSTGSITSMVSQFGGIRSLFRGMSAPLSAAALINAVIFSSYGQSSRLWDEHIGRSDTQDSNIAVEDRERDPFLEEAKEMHDSSQKAFVCGSFAGFMQALLICPMEHIKCRIQIQHGKGAADNLYSGPFDATRKILRNHGISGLYRGWLCTCWREVPAFGLYFATYDWVKDRTNSFLANRAGVEDYGPAYPHHTHTWLASALAGGASGSVTWAAIYPFDVIKSRIQTAPFDAPSHRVKILSVAKDIVSKQGWSYMFRGLGVTLIRAFPVNGIIFPVYEFTLLHISGGYDTNLKMHNS